MSSPARSEEALREAVAHHVEARSLRAVAQEVGLTHGGLRKFLEGSRPRPATMRKLLSWYASRTRQLQGMTANEASALIEALLREVPLGARTGARKEIQTALERCYAPGRTVPAWVRKLGEDNL